MDSEGQAAAQARKLTKVYGEGATRVVAVDQVSVDFRRAEYTAIWALRAPASPP
jgi:putative ABC transport system ATP-binding protein